MKSKRLKELRPLRDVYSATVQLPEGIPPFIHIKQNYISERILKKLKEKDPLVCECKFDALNPESACGEGCLNVLTNTECTPGRCPCGENCRNQKFQKCEYAKTKLFKTEGRGWGLLADENLKSGQFIIEYCGEVISSEEAEQRSQSYEDQGLKDAYIIKLKDKYYIDATKKGSLARFINHSCQPNCETRKWTVLGVTRVGIYAKKDISVGTELAYDYNFEWYGGANVRCLCGAPNCCLFLGAKSHGFQEHNHVWEEGDDRYMVENVPLYDSAEDEPFPGVAGPAIPSSHETIATLAAMDNGESSKSKLEAAATGTESHFVFGAKFKDEESAEIQVNKAAESGSDGRQGYPQTNSATLRIRSDSAYRNFNAGAGYSSRRRPPHIPKAKPKVSGKKYTPSKPIAQLFASKEAQEEITRCEENRNKATANLNSVYDEIRPAIEEHEWDGQDNVPTSAAEKWIKASCSQLMAEFDLHFAVVKNTVCPKPADGEGRSGTN